MIDLTDKVFHIRILYVKRTNYFEPIIDISIGFEILDGPLAGQQIQAPLEGSTKQKYLEEV